MRALAMALLLVGAGLSLLPSVLATEDTFAHRYIVYGRLFDAGAFPVRDVLVDVGLPASLGTPEECPPQPAATLEALGSARTQRRTSNEGDFVFCFHVHAIPAGLGMGLVRVDEVGFIDEFPVDPLARVTFLNLQLGENLTANRTDALNASHMVVGRLWYPAPGSIVEDVPVDALVRAGVAVEITLDPGDGNLIKGTTKTNVFGDFAVDVPVPARPTHGAVRLISEGKQLTLPLQTTTGMTPFRFEVAPPSEGLSTGAVIALGAAGVLAMGAIAWSVARRATNK